jgi:hypothetical protein
MLSLFKHLLPRAKAWQITVDKQLRQLFEGLSESVEDTSEFLGDIWFDLFPATTRELTAWEAQFGIPTTGDVTDADRRDRLAALWSAQGGQDPRYIQDTLQASGFDVYVHEWWVPGTDPPIARNPGIAFGGQPLACGDSVMECGETVAQCGESWAALGQTGYALVNKLYTSDGTNLERVEYTIPQDQADWPYCLYICGENFGDFAQVSSARQGELEDLILKICPAHLWVIVGITFQTFLADGDDVLTDGVSGPWLTEGS